MIMKKALFLLIFIAAVSFRQGNEEKPSYQKYFTEYKVQGAFVLYDLHKDKYTFYNKDWYDKAFTPASTFKIFNSMVALETGAVKDENEVLKWDGQVRQNPAWNKDTDMAAAYKNSTVWFYQEMARRAGENKMNEYITKANYGNKNTGGGIDKFWLTGELRITPAQQIEFLKKLYRNDLPFSQRSIDIVKKIMIAEQTEKYTLRAKTGWGMVSETDQGWYVGYLEQGGNIYFFATIVECSDPKNEQFAKSRIEITRSILKEEGLL
jgi:beta-lactamase class D